MSISGRNQRYIYKLSSSRLKRSNWNLNLKLSAAIKNGEVVALGESQLLRWIDELNGIENCEEKITKIKLQIEDYRRQLKTDVNLKPVLKSLYQQLDHYQFKKDYICVVMDKVADYKYIYKNGFVVNGVKYRRLLGTSAGIKLNTIVFVNENLLPEIKRRITNGRNLEKEFVPAKLEAYQALVCSSSIPVSMPKGVICVPDCFTHFKSDVIELDDSEGDEPKMTFVKDKECELCDSDGYGLGMPSLLKRWGEDLGVDYILSGCVIRNSFCKGTIYPVDFRQFALDNGFFEITDSWGYKHNIEDVELILTESMLKLWDSYSSIDDYLEKCAENKYSFCITKAAEKELENVRNMNYQFLQSYEFSEEDIDKLLEPTITEVLDVLQNDWRKTITYCKGVNLNSKNIIQNIRGDFATALMIEPKLLNDDFVQNQLQGMIHKRINDAKKGVLKVDGCYTLISGDPYALCQSIFGLEVTGLLKAGEVYSRYWLDKGVNEAVMFRAPMTVHSNIKKMRVVHNQQMDKFYEYLTTPIIFNAWDTSADAMNGFDKDGDCVITTSNEVLINNTKNLPAVQCIQYKAKKCIPNENDIFESNILGFGNAVGGITNKVTSMFEVQAKFPKDSEEYQIMNYRTMCGQLFQQESIDAIKGIKAKPMPKYWYDWYATKIDENDSLEVQNWKTFQRTIAADKKPYFFRYVYPSENTRWLKYQKDNEFKCLMVFGKELHKLLSSSKKTDEEKNFVDYYYKRLPLGIAPCTINKICWKIEDVFKKDNLSSTDSFDYTVLKSGLFEYDKQKYKLLKEVYKNYIKERRDFDKIIHAQKMDSYDVNHMKHLILSEFIRSTSYICPNKKELCDILLDICYENSLASKRFVWDLCGDVIIDNLLEKNQFNIFVPIENEFGEFEFCGKKFNMEKINLNDIK